MAEERHDGEIDIERVDAGRKGGEAIPMGAVPVARTRTVSWSAAVWAGIIAGAVFLVLEMLMVPLFAAGSPWGPPRMIAAIVMGQGVLPPPATFDLGVVMAAMAVHFLLSIAYALVLASIVYWMSSGGAMSVGGLFGFVLYVVNFHFFTEFFPWFANARNWITFFAHVMFGIVAAAAYKALTAPARDAGAYENIR